MGTHRRLRGQFTRNWTDEKEESDNENFPSTDLCVARHPGKSIRGGCRPTKNRKISRKAAKRIAAKRHKRRKRGWMRRRWGCTSKREIAAKERKDRKMILRWCALQFWLVSQPSVRTEDLHGAKKGYL